MIPTVAYKYSIYPALLVLVLLVSSCGTLSRTPKREAKPPPAIDFPDKNAAGKKIGVGRASWYGPKFHGKLTANGEQYDMHRLTAAHRTLPFNSIVKVNNLDNGKEVMVRINDRGPFAKNRIIDLSKKAARAIGMIGNGTARVALTLMQEDLADSSITVPKIATYTVQLGSFKDEFRAFEQSRHIKGSRVVQAQLPDRKVYRVYYGTFTDKKEARKERRILRKKGFKGYVKQIQN